MTSVVFELILIFVLLVVNGLFALAEIALVSARPARLQQRAELGDKGAAVALDLARDPTRFLSTVQVGITLVGILAGAFGGATIAEGIALALSGVPVLAPYGDALGLIVVVTGLTYFSLVIGELVPKRLALNNPEQLAARLAAPVQLLSRLAGPLVQVLSASTNLLLKLLRVQATAEPLVTAEEIKILVEQGATTGVIERTEHDIVASALHLDDRRVSQAMTPRTAITWLNLAAPLDTVKEQITASPHSYFPVAAGGLDDVRGLLRGRDLLARLLTEPNADWTSLMRPAPFLPESQTVLDALHLLKSTGAPLALIIDEYGGLQGMITPTDLLETLVGDMATPGQPPEPDAVQRDDGSWLLDGRLAISRMAALLDLPPALEAEADDYDTLGGFVMERLAQVPTVGQHFDYAARRFEVVDMDGRRVDRVLVSPAPDANSAQA